MWGGVLFSSDIISQLIPEFRKDAPLERYLSRQRLSFLSEKSSICLDLRLARYSYPLHNDYIVLRAPFDRWFAHKVEQAGGIVATGLSVTNLLWNEGQVVGVEAGGDKFAADLVIACDGVNSILVQKAGLRRKLSPREVKLGVKEVIKLPRDMIEQRFNLTGDEGIAWEFIGAATGGIPGGGFLYTNKESISLGIVVQLESLLENKVNASDLFDNFKAQSVVRDLVKGGEMVEYSAHLIPTAGLSIVPSLYTGGFLVAGDAAALALGTGLILEGANFAIASGMAAAEAVKTAKKINDFSKQSLSYYQTLLEDSFVIKDLRTFKRAPRFLENSRLYTTYPDLACSIVERIYAGDSKPRKKLWQIAREEMKGRISLRQLITDLIEAGRAL
jgi:electron transfer flavoprotein-quinone oxidoreductase